MMSVVTQALPRKASDLLCPGPGLSSQLPGEETVVKLRQLKEGDSSGLVPWDFSQLFPMQHFQPGFAGG